MYCFGIYNSVSVDGGSIMSDVRAPYDDEIDLFEIFNTLWEGRWKVIGIATLAAIVSFFISLVKSDLYSGSTPLNKEQSSMFTKYLSVNELLQNNGFGYTITAQFVFDAFVSEFSDYKEVIEVLEENDYIKQRLQDLSVADKRYFLIEMAKNFEILPPLKNESDWKLHYEWHDAGEGKKIFSQSMNNVLTKVRKTILLDIDEIALAVLIRNKNQKRRLHADLIALEDAINLDRAKHLLFLKEQSAIAKELGVENNSLNESGLLKSKSAGVALSVTSSDIPFYLRGFKAIDKEIDILSSRSKEQRFAINGIYVSIKKELSALNNDVSAEQIMSVKETVANDDVSNWVAYDLSLAKVNAQNKPVLYMILAIMVGGMIGALYVLASGAVRKQKARAVKV